jgi:hypothetical protein
MKKLIPLVLGLTLAFGTVTASFAKESTNKSEKKKHKKPKSGHQSTDKNNSRWRASESKLLGRRVAHGLYAFRLLTDFVLRPAVWGRLQKGLFEMMRQRSIRACGRLPLAAEQQGS